MKNFLVCLIILFPLLSILPAQDETLPICINEKVQNNPRISGDIIVWEDLRHQTGFTPNARIYMYDLASETETMVSEPVYHAISPDIDGQRIVWQKRSNNMDICYYDLETETLTNVCTEDNNQILPAIQGDNIVWEDWRNGNGDIYLYNISTKEETAVCTDEGDQKNPAIFDHYIVWEDWSGDYAEICLYDLLLDSKIVISDAAGHQLSPAIYRNIIVWQDNGSGNGDIVFYDMDSKQTTPLTSDDFFQGEPDIDSTSIVWRDDRNGNQDIYLYNLETQQEVKITENSSNQSVPAIYHNRIVFTDWRNGNPDIYMHTLIPKGPGRRITTDPEDQKLPQIWGNRIVWQDERNDVSEIYAFNLLSNEEEPISTIDLSPQSMPDIWQNRVVWLEKRGLDGVSLYDLNTGIPTLLMDRNTSYHYPKIWDEYIAVEGYTEQWGGGTTAAVFFYNTRTGKEKLLNNPIAMSQFDPDIYQNYIVYSQSISDDPVENRDIYLYNTDTGVFSQITTNDSVQQSPAIYGNWIVWQDQRNGNADIYAYNRLNHETRQITDDEFDQTYPDIYGDLIVWMDNRNGDWDIYMHDLSTGEETEVCVWESNQTLPAIWENRIVWTDWRHGNGDIYLWEVELPEGADLGVTIEAQPATVSVGYYVTYEISADNAGSLPASNVVVSNILPGDADLVSSSTDQGLISTDNGVITWEIGDLSTNSSALLTVVMKTKNPGILKNTAQISGNEYDPFYANNSATLNTEVSTIIGQTIDQGENPALATDQSGNAYVLYSDKENRLCYAHNSGGEWATEIISGESRSYDLAIDSSGHTHVFYSDYDTQTQTFYLKYIHNTSGQWSGTETLATVDGSDEHSGVWSVNAEIDVNEDIHLCYMEAAGMATEGDIHYLNYTNGNWVDRIAGKGYDRVALALGTDNTPHFTYYRIQDAALCYSYYDGTFHTETVVQSIGGQLEGMVCDIDVDVTGTPHLSFCSGTDEDNTYGVKNDTWSVDILDEGGFYSAGNSVAVSPDGTVHVTYHHIKTGKLIYASKSNAAWEKSVLGPGGMVNQIKADELGNIHFAFESNGKIQYLVKRVVTDEDFDGISDQEESGPNGDNDTYDGNQDGTPDKDQHHVTSFKSYGQDHYITLAVADSLILTDVQAVDIAAPDEAPEGFEFIYDLFQFTIFNLTPGAPVDLILYLNDQTQFDGYFKFGPTHAEQVDHWYDFMFDGQTGAVIEPDSIVLHFIDGQRGDNDLRVNGIIIEPGAPATINANQLTENDVIPGKFYLAQNFPNPFNGETIIQYELARVCEVEIAVFNILGQKIVSLEKQKKPAGKYTIRWDGRNGMGNAAASGIYIMRMNTSEFTAEKKLLLLR